MTINDALKEAVRQLETTKITDAQASARFLLEHVLNLDALALMTNADQRIANQELDQFWPLVLRRARHEPVAYIVGYKDFCSLRLQVNPAVLIPRSETELLVNLVIEYVQAILSTTPSVILDIGTGSGAIILALANNLKQRNDLEFIATDTSKEALDIARENATQLGLNHKITFNQADLLQKLPRTLQENNSVDIIVANLPYIPSARIEKLEPDVKDYEPHLALDGGIDGFDQYRKLFDQMMNLDRLPSAVFCEIDESQAEIFTKEVKKRWPKAQIEIKKDLALYDRFAIIKNLSN